MNHLSLQDRYHRFDPGDIIKMINREYPEEYYYIIIINEEHTPDFEAIFYNLYHLDDGEYYQWCLAKYGGFAYEKVA